MPTSTYQPIATYTAPSAQSSYTFNSFSGYTDIVLIAQVQSDAGGYANFNIRFNSDTGSNYSRVYMYGNGTTAGTGKSAASTDTSITLGTMPSTSQGYWNISRVNIQNYSNSTTYKTVLNRSDLLNDATYAGVGLWRNTAAITSITLFSSSGNIATGSTFTLYGIRAA